MNPVSVSLNDAGIDECAIVILEDLIAEYSVSSSGISNIRWSSDYSQILVDISNNVDVQDITITVKWATTNFLIVEKTATFSILNCYKEEGANI